MRLRRAWVRASAPRGPTRAPSHGRPRGLVGRQAAPFAARSPRAQFADSARPLPTTPRRHARAAHQLLVAAKKWLQVGYLRLNYAYAAIASPFSRD